MLAGHILSHKMLIIQSQLKFFCKLNVDLPIPLKEDTSLVRPRLIVSQEKQLAFHSHEFQKKKTQMLLPAKAQNRYNEKQYKPKLFKDHIKFLLGVTIRKNNCTNAFTNFFITIKVYSILSQRSKMLYEVEIVQEKF